MVDEEFDRIAEDKQKRKAIQLHLIKCYKKNLVSILVDYPGPKKDNYITKNITRCMEDIFKGIFTTKLFLEINWITYEGPVVIMLIEGDIREIKKTCAEIQDKHILGGCVIFDVYDLYGQKIMRKDLGYPPKKCFLCGDELEKCRQNNKHSEKEIITKINEIYMEYLKKHNDNY